MPALRLAAGLAALLALAVAACGDDGPATASGSCRDVGEVTEVTDGPGDVQPNIAVPPPPPAPPALDLERAAMARSDAEICAEWTVEAPVREMRVFSLLLREAGEGDSGALVNVSAIVLAHGDTQVQLLYPSADERPDQGLVEGKVDVEGNRVSMRVRRSLLPTYLSLDHFEWEAKTLAAGDRPNLQYSDCAPELGHNVAYPGGDVIELEHAAVC